jgi:hypothetical protein
MLADKTAATVHDSLAGEALAKRTDSSSENTLARLRYCGAGIIYL